MRRERIRRALDHLIDIRIVERNALEGLILALRGLLEIGNTSLFTLLEIGLERHEPVRLQPRQPEPVRHFHIRDLRQFERVILFC